MPDTTQSDNLKVWSNDPAAPMVLRAGKAPIPSVKTTLGIADFVECDFPGYSGVTLNDFDLTDEENADLGNCLSSPKSFVASENLTDPQEIHVLYVTRHRTGETADVLAVSIVDPPILVSVPGQEVPAQVRAESFGL